MILIGIPSLLGLFFLSITPGYQTDLLRYMFGSIAIATMTDVYLVFALAVLIVICCCCFWRGILASCFNTNLLRLNGGHAFFFELLSKVISFENKMTGALYRTEKP